MGGYKPPLQALWRVLAPYRWQTSVFVVLGVLAALAEGLGIGLMIPLLQGTAPTSDIPHIWLDRLWRLFPTESRVESLTLLILAAILCKVVLAYAFTTLAAWIGSRVHHDLRVRMVAQVLAVSQQYLDVRPVGTLLHTLTGAAAEARFAVTCLLWLLLNISTLLVFTAMLIAIAWKITLGIVMGLLLLFAVVHAATRGVKTLGRRSLNRQSALSHRIKEILLGIRTIRAFGQEGYEQERFAAESLACHRAQVGQDLLASLIHPLSEGLAAIALMGLVFVTLKAGLSLPVLATVVFMLLRLLPQLQSASNQWALILARQAAVEEVLDLMNPPGTAYVRAGGRRLDRWTQGIRYERIGFSYPQRDHAALSDIDLDIVKGQTIALVGPSGAGKSTLIQLLCRFYDPTAGRIWVDGQDMLDFDPASWRARIAMVSQDIHIFSTTVRDNIAYGKPGATEAEIVAAARRAHADEFIAGLPQGYDTLVGDRGLLLSGGQRQRLSIARAILCDPEILILDEATNALDTLAETHIQAAIEELGRHRTVIVVAHRLSTIQRADRIVVLDQGRIVEQGRFAELLARNGLFARLYRSHELGLADEASPPP